MKQVVASAPPRSSSVGLYGAIAPGWQLITPLLIEIERDEDGEFIVSDNFSTVYGNGKTQAKAIKDYCSSLIDYYEILESQANTNGPAALLLNRFRGYLNKTDL
jgi:hypothetical protein